MEVLSHSLNHSATPYEWLSIGADGKSGQLGLSALIDVVN